MHVIFHKSFEKEYKKIKNETRKKFKERLNIFLTDPNVSILNIHRLHGKYKGYKSFNVGGDIRAIYKEETNVVIFVSIGSHSELYG